MTKDELIGAFGNDYTEIEKSEFMDSFLEVVTTCKQPLKTLDDQPYLTSAQSTIRQLSNEQKQRSGWDRRVSFEVGRDFVKDNTTRVYLKKQLQKG